MSVIPRVVFVLVLVVSPILVFVTSSPLPAQVATHFGPGGRANGWMSHDHYLLFMLFMGTVLPLLVAGATGLVPAMARAMIRKHAPALASARLDDTVRWLGGHGAWIGALVCLLFLAIHFLTLDANARTPPRLDESVFIAVMIAFLVLLAIWILALALRLRRRQEPQRR